MLKEFAWTILLTSITVATHMLYSLYLIRALRYRPARRLPRLAQHTQRLFLLVGSVIALLLLHCLETTYWALFYVYARGLPDFATSLYFSILSYATIGYGDVVLPSPIRLVGAMEGMVGTMMSGWSVALLIAVVQGLNVRNQKSAS